MRAIAFSLLVMAAVAGSAAAQQATEQYIPIGQSPGGVTMQGQLSASVEPAGAGGEATFTMAAAAGAPEVSYVLSPTTRIYIDNSARGQPNTMGAIADLQPGRTVEVRVSGTEARTALWIKVRGGQ